MTRFPVVGRLLSPGVAVMAVFFGCLGTMLFDSFVPNLGMAKMGRGFTLQNYATFLGDPFSLSYLWRSLRVAAYTTVITLLCGYAVAYFMSLCGRRLRLLISLVLLVQFFTSFVIRTYAIALVLGRGGVVNETLLALGLIDAPLKLIFNEFAVALGIIMVAIPFAVFPIYSSLAGIPSNLATAAASLGADQTRIFREITFPMSLPGVSAAVILVILFNLTSFITPALLGGGYFDMIANLIYDQAMNTQNYPLAGATSAVCLIVSVAVVYSLQLFFSKAIRGTDRS